MEDYKLFNRDTEKPDPFERNKFIVFNEEHQLFADDWKWSTFDTYYKNNEEIPRDSKLLIYTKRAYMESN